MDIRVILHNIRSTHNVGSIFRTSDAAGISHIYISGYTPSPLDAFGRKRKDIAKVALGAEDIVSWEKITHVSKLLKDLKKENFKILALEQNRDSVDYKKIKLKARSNTVIIVGNEVKGMSHSLLSHADTVIEIPMKGNKESLNVSVAFGIAIFRILNV
jgi:23S rRNA (guanosine2251-2'-O)-methyltransferase